jgi:hypothetical protein
MWGLLREVTDMDVARELIRAAAWLVIGFTGGLVTYPFAAGWWTDGED